jgi:hypothetical protein
MSLQDRRNSRAGNRRLGFVEMMVEHDVRRAVRPSGPFPDSASLHGK